MGIRHTVRRFDSHSEAEEADRAYYRSLTPQQRLDLLIELVYGNRDPNDPLPKDLREFVESFRSHGVEYVIVGGYALAFHGHPRYTGDLDFLVRATQENAERVHRAIVSFGFASIDVSPEDFTREGQVVQLGQPPNRIDILTSLTGVSFDEVWNSRVSGTIAGLKVSLIDRDSLIKNKRALGRAQDLADIAALEQT